MLMGKLRRRKVIKFRGKKVNGEGWSYGNLIQYQEKFFIQEFENFSEKVEVIENTVCQYIGLKDISGRDIFSGDVLRVNSDGFFEFYEIVWDEENLMFYPKDDGLSREHIKYVNVWEQVVTIYGNIHDTPNIMGTQENKGEE
jgi:uncharacterized phage protein (TIGR01671 family)